MAAVVLSGRIDPRESVRPVSHPPEKQEPTRTRQSGVGSCNVPCVRAI